MTPRPPPPPILPAIVVDTREQAPLDFTPWKLETIRAGLRTADYSLAGFEDRIVVERKSLPDLYACIGRERDRFDAELRRMAAIEHRALVVEADLVDVARGCERSAVHPHAAVGSVVAWSVRYRVPVWFAHDPRHAAALVVKLLRAAHKEITAAPAAAGGTAA